MVIADLVRTGVALWREAGHARIGLIPLMRTLFRSPLAHFTWLGSVIFFVTAPRSAHVTRQPVSALTWRAASRPLACVADARADCCKSEGPSPSSGSRRCATRTI